MSATKYRVLLIVSYLIALAAIVTSAYAADMPVKAPPPKAVFQGYPVNSGFYFGVNAAMEQQAVGGTVGGVNIGTVNATQGDVGLTLGYVWAQSGAPVWWAVEGTFDYTNISGNNGFFSLNGPVNFSQIAILGAPWDAITSFLPNLGVGPFPGLPALPNGVTAGPGQLYIFLGVKESDVSAQFMLQSFREWTVKPIMGPGLRALLSNKTAVDVRFEYSPPTQTKCFGPIVSCSQPSSQYTVRTSVDF